VAVEVVEGGGRGDWVFVGINVVVARALRVVVREEGKEEEEEEEGNEEAAAERGWEYPSLVLLVELFCMPVKV
jgi:hypothetical protein